MNVIDGPDAILLRQWQKRVSASGVLDLAGSGLKQLPHVIADLTGLKALHLARNELTELPPWFAQLTDLRELNLAGNDFASLPQWLAQLKDLRGLNLAGNDFAELPSVVSQFPGLQVLNLAGNHLTEVPPALARLTNLRELVLAGNHIATLPSEMCELGSLWSLDASNNCLTGLPLGFGTMSMLDTVKLSNNELRSLPASMGSLPRLRRLDVSRNVISALPGELAPLFRRGVHMRMHHNPWQEPLPELLARGNDAVATYLESLADGIRQYEGKVMLVGEGSVGKSSLAAALTHQPFVHDRPTTHGIEIQTLELPIPEADNKMRLHLWDFGGQEVYRATHQFFFTKRAVYVLVWNAREGQERNEVSGWLDRIKSRIGDECRVLVVATHCDERHPELDYPSLKLEFKEVLAGQHEVDNLSRTGIEQLRDLISTEAFQLPQMGQTISKRWISVRDEIGRHAQTKPYASFQEISELCARHGLDREATTTLVNLMNDLGLLIYYGDDDGLREIVVLNPEWLTKAIGYVLEDKQTRAQNGIMEHERLNRIWGPSADRAGYPREHHPYFLRLMEKFDVSYRLDDQRSLVAQLVEYERPTLPWEPTSEPRPGVRSLTLFCELSRSAPGLISWLTVRHHDASVGAHWRGGVFLRHPLLELSAEALIELVDDRRVRIDVRSPSPDYFMHVLGDSIRYLLVKRWHGITYEFLVPCPTGKREDPCGGRFRLWGLRRALEQGDTHHRCDRCGERYELVQLLTGFGLPAGELMDKIDAIAAQMDDVKDDIERTRSHTSETAQALRMLTKATSLEVSDCPRTFELIEKGLGWRIKNMPTRGFSEIFLGPLRAVLNPKLRLQLWCEAPGNLHPVPEAIYEFSPPALWRERVGPYANLVLKMLRVAVPIAGAVAGILLPEDRAYDKEFELAKAFVAGAPEDLNSEFSLSHLTPAEGAGLRVFRELLFRRLDRSRTFGGLRRAQQPSGEFLWLCTDHYRDYDPGLPVL